MVKKFVKSVQIDTKQIFKNANVSPENLLFFDIETTGLSRAKNHVCIVGFGKIKGDVLTVTQFISESSSDEPELLFALKNEYSADLTTVTFNGTRFDLPFVNERMAQNNIEFSFDEGTCYDLYKEIKDFAGSLALSDCRQQTLELFLHTGRKDSTDGRQLVKNYKVYSSTGNPDLENAVLLHNFEDIKGLVLLFELFSVKKKYEDLKSTLDITDISVKSNKYKDMNGFDCDEILVDFNLNKSLINPVTLTAKSLFIKAEADSGIASIRFFKGNMKYFFKDYKNYFYLPEEGTCIHKDLAKFVDANHKEKAKPHNCFAEKNSCFIPVLCENIKYKDKQLPVFRSDYMSVDSYIEADENMLNDMTFLKVYLLSNILNNLS
ncbi:MAG: ribonuclease H-like domain-containing protein [Lachnospiraceae bacterium]|nr:ribonuclease H-like domain-containing protein [Lachnospiraceae bacterium]